MAIYHDLDNTGQEVQQRLDQVPVTQADLAEEVLSRQAAVGAVQNNVDAEELRAKAAEKLNADDIDAIEEKIPSGASSSNKMATVGDVSDEATARENADATLQQAIEAILLLIPSTATSLNKLADKNFVNSSVATATATFRGTKNLVSDLELAVDATHEQIAEALATSVTTADNNDYAFVQVPTSAETPAEIRVTERYKFDGTAWSYEYDLNNSGFTADQWAAINSGITEALVTKLSALPNNADLTAALGVLTNGIASINEKIPAAASSSNKLVDTAAMQSYITQILGAIDATFNITSTDGHVTIQITQTDGVITALAVTTNDIASAADVAQLFELYNALQQSDPEIIQPTDTWPVANPSTTDIYRVIDRVNTPPQNYSDYMFSAADLTTPILMATYNNAIDPRPKKGSQNLVTSGGVFDNMGALDVSELNATENPHTPAIYADLSAALAAIPSGYQGPGMSIKFMQGTVQSVDNKYVQYMYIGTSTAVADFTNTANWEKVNLADELSKIDTNFTELTALYDDEKQRPAALDTEGKKITSVPYSYMTPRFIGVNPNQEFAYKLRMASGNLIIAFYSSNNEDSFISGIQSDNTIQEGTINAPSTAKYMRFCTYDFGDTSIGYYIKTGMLLLENEISALKEDTAIINITNHYPPASGYYQLTDSTAVNYAPSAITDSKYQTPGRILLFRSGLTEWLAYKFVGGNNTVWSNRERWVKIADANDIEELQSQIRSTGVTNVTTLIPLESGYYQCSDANEANYAPQALLNYNVNYRKRGAMIKIEVSEYKWETYIFEGAISNDSWLSPTRWKRLLSTDDLNDIPVGEETEMLNLNTSEQLLIVGQSHAMGHGSIKNKSFASYLSALTDWNVLNMGEDGSNYIKHLSYILNNTTLGTGAKFGDCNGGGVCLDFLGGNAENPYFNNGMDGKYTENNIKRLYSTLKSKGFDVICCNAFGDQPNSIDCIQAIVAKELGLQLVDINSECARITQKLFTPYWYSGHFGTRTNAIQVNSLLNTIKLRRPRTAIKLFRNRISATNDELLYDNVFEKVKLWEEVSVNHRALSTANNKYVDRLDKIIADGLHDDAVTSEYTTLKNGNALTFADKGLVEFVLPCTCDGLNNLKFRIAINGTASIYARRFIDSSLTIATTPASANFKVSGGVSGISVGDVFTDTLNSGVSFTVTKVDSESNTIICNASGTFVTPGQTTDTLTRTSDSATFTATSLIEGVPAGYVSASENPFGKWEAVTADSDGYIILSNLGAYMDYDKVTFLVDGDSSFTIGNVYATYDKPSVSKDYNTDGFVSIVNDKGLAHTSVLTDVFVEGNMEGVVSDDEGSYFWNGKETVDGVEMPHIPDFYAAKGATSILHLKAGDKVSYTISDLARTNPETDAVTHLRVKIVARYFPASNLNINAGTFTVTPQTFDFGKLGFKYAIGNSDAVYTDEFYVPASFVEIYKDVYLSGKSGNSFDIVAIDNDVELLYLEIIK